MGMNLLLRLLRRATSTQDALYTDSMTTIQDAVPAGQPLKITVVSDFI